MLSRSFLSFVLGALPVALPILAIGCALPPVSLVEGTREYVPFDYDQILKRWTRTESLVALAELDDLLTVTSTFESWDFRWAYVVRYAEDYRLTVEQRRVLLENTLGETRKQHQFYLALYGPNRRWNDLSRKSSAWVVRLIDDKGNETAPTEIVAIPKPSALERTYFPYTTVWRQAFRIKFPVAHADGRTTLATDARWFGIRFAGAQGHQDIVWHLEPGTAKAVAEGAPMNLTRPM